MHTRRDYVNFPSCHTVSSTFNYLYLLPFNGLIAFLSAIYRREQKVFWPLLLLPFRILDSRWHSCIRDTFSPECEHGVNARSGGKSSRPRFSPVNLPNWFSSVDPSKMHPPRCPGPASTTAPTTSRNEYNAPVTDLGSPNGYTAARTGSISNFDPPRNFEKLFSRAYTRYHVYTGYIFERVHDTHVCVRVQQH